MKNYLSLFLLLFLVFLNSVYSQKTEKTPYSYSVYKGMPNYIHDYHQSLVYKIQLDIPEDGEKVSIDFTETLEIIRTLNDITGGLKQIVYLVGWQFDGHDSKYPAWSEVNHRLKRPGDPDARSSLLWLAAEAKKYNAFISVHINMSDAYMNSPLWDEYLKNGLIVLGKDGEPRKTGFWGGQTSYNVDKVKEWETGFAQKRIDGILKLLPFIKENGTVHIDAFGLIGDNNELKKSVNAILDYWHEKGVDVTTEYFDFETAGKIPMVWVLSLTEENRLKYPPNIICGGGSAVNQRNINTRNLQIQNWAFLPEAGCLFPEAWGKSLGLELRESRGKLNKIVERICTETLQWYFLNQHRALSNYQDTANYSVIFSDGIKTNVRKSDRYFTLHQGNRILVDGDNIFMPALWTQNNEWWAFNKSDKPYTWPVPVKWKGAKELKAVRLTDKGRKESFFLSVKNNKISIEPLNGEVLALSPKH